MTLPFRSNDIGPAYVYRVYDPAGTLIYVGCTTDLETRIRTHATGTWWAPQAARVKARVYPTVREARAVESEAIRDEKPRWNMMGRGPRSRWDAQDYDDWLIARRSSPNAYTAFARRQIARVERERNLFFDSAGNRRSGSIAVEIEVAS